MFMGGVLPLSNPLTPKPDENDASSELMKHDVELTKNEGCLESAEATILHSQDSRYI